MSDELQRAGQLVPRPYQHLYPEHAPRLRRLRNHGTVHDFVLRDRDFSDCQRWAAPIRRPKRTFLVQKDVLRVHAECVDRTNYREEANLGAEALDLRPLLRRDLPDSSPDYPSRRQWKLRVSIEQ